MNKNYIILCFLSLIYIGGLNAQNYDISLSGSVNQNIEEGEAHIAINPIDSTEMIVGFMELGTGVNFKIYNSSDEGNTWQLSSYNTASAALSDYPNHSIIGGGDIVFAYDNNGVLYCSWINLLADLSIASPLDSCIWASYWAKSNDNGANFTLENGTDHFFARGKLSVNGGLNVYDFEDGVADRQWMAVNLSDGPNQNDLFIGYINYPFNLQNTGLKVKRKAAGQSNFSPEVTAYPGNGQLTNITFDQNDVLHYSFVDIATNTVNHTSSSDNGQTFSSPNLIYNGNNLFPQSNYKINDRENAAPSLAIDGSNKLHLVWGDFLFNETLPSSFYSNSSDGGATWSIPVELNTIFGGQVFMPIISAKNNHVSISGNLLDSTKKSIYHIASSNDNGQNFSTPLSISAGVTDFNQIGNDIFVGDYSSGIRTDCAIYSLWTDCSSNGCKQYIARYDECLSLGLNELTPIENHYTIQNIYPNPSIHEVQLEIQAQNSDELTLEIYNSAGQVVNTTSFVINTGLNNKIINIEQLKSGVYILKTTGAEGIFNTRIFTKQ